LLSSLNFIEKYFALFLFVEIDIYKINLAAVQEESN